jgi:hypothetical protein
MPAMDRPPLTDEDLDALERAANDMVPGQVAVTFPVDYARRLMAEVRRLRSDEWLKAAAAAVAVNLAYLEDEAAQDPTAAELHVFDILKARRDGDA